MHYQRRGHHHPSGNHPSSTLHHPGGHGVSSHAVHHKHKHKKGQKGQKYGLHGHHGQLTSKVQVHPVQMMEALSAYNNSATPAVDFVIKENVIAAHAHVNNNAAVAQQQRESEHNRQLDLHLAAISRMQQR